MRRTVERDVIQQVLAGLRRRPELIHVIIGPRQVGKTTAALAVARHWSRPFRYAAADTPLPPGPEWIQSEWNLARAEARRRTSLLILDEVQKVRGWGEVVKACWDEDRRKGTKLKVLILGSSSLLLSQGTAESLAGRFFLHRCLHWSLAECRDAFGWDLDRWIFHGGYPGAAPLASTPVAWRAYIQDSLIETVLARDVLALQNVTKPTLLRHLFALAAGFPAQVLAYNKMLGQLQDAGNTVTLAHYLKLLETAFLLSGLDKYSAGKTRLRGSSPKLIFWNNALLSASSLRTFTEVRRDPALWGRWVENAVGAHLLNHLQALPYEVCYWRDGDDEVDFVVRAGGKVWGVEVKSGRPRSFSGLRAFLKRYPQATPLIVGSEGMGLEEFFLTDPADLFR